MADRAAMALARARAVLDTLVPEPTAKRIWGSPAGKTHLAQRIVAEVPEHRVYVEPFAGGAQVLFAKEPSEVEVVGDLDPEIAFAFRFAKGLTSEQLERLRRKKWVGDKEHFRKLYESEPPDDEVDRFYRFAYLIRFSFNKLRRGTMPDRNVGIEARFVDKLERWAPRLKAVRVRCADYEKVIEEYDGPDTFFFLDPPYAGYDADCRVGAGHKDWDEERFGKVLRKIRGRFLCTYGLRGDPDLFKGFQVRRWRHTSGVGTSQGGRGLHTGVTLVATNYDPDKVRRFQVAVSKTIWGSPAGKKKVAKRLVALLPRHKTYVEPFAGAAALLYAKEPSEKEVLADNDADVVFLHRSIKAMTPERVAELGRRFEWKCTEASFTKARDMEPKDDVARFYKLVFVRTHARDCRPDGTHPARNHLGSTTNPEKYLRAAERLKDVTVLHQDYRKTVEQLDGPETFFFLDPPYPGEWFDKDAAIEVEEFVGVLKGIKGRFIAVLNDSAENAAAFKSVGHVFRLKVHEASGTGGAKKASRLSCANFKVAKADGVELLGEPAETDKAAWSRAFINDLPDSAFLHVEPGGTKDEDGKTVPRSLRHFPVRDDEGELDVPHLRKAVSRIPQAKIPGLTADDLRELQDMARRLLAEAQKADGSGDRAGAASFAKSIPLIKGVDPNDERFVLGVVLEPEVVDAQGDIYSPEEIRQAAHRFMEEFGGLGLMHRFRVNDQVKVLESYLAPADLAIGEARVRKGTWLLAVRILSDELWQQVKDGALTGFSIGGSARRVPEGAAAVDAEVEQRRAA